MRWPSGKLVKNEDGAQIVFQMTRMISTQVCRPVSEMAPYRLPLLVVTPCASSAIVNRWWSDAPSSHLSGSAICRGSIIGWEGVSFNKVRKVGMSCVCVCVHFILELFLNLVLKIYMEKFIGARQREKGWTARREMTSKWEVGKWFPQLLCKRQHTKKIKMHKKQE